MSKTPNKNPLASQSRRRHKSDCSDFRWFACSAAENKPTDVRQKLGRWEGRLAGQMKFAVPGCAHTAGPSLSPPDSDCGTERSGARAGGRRSRGHAESSGVKRSEPDGVRVLAQ